MAVTKTKNINLNNIQRGTKDWESYLNQNADILDTEIKNIKDKNTNQDTRIDNIVAGAGTSNTEIVDARLGADGIARANLGSLVREIHKDNINSARQTQNLSHGTSVINGSVGSPINVEFYGNTLVNLLGNYGGFEVVKDGNTVPEGWKDQFGVNNSPRYSNTSDSYTGTRAVKISSTDARAFLYDKPLNFETGKYYLLAYANKSTDPTVSINGNTINGLSGTVTSYRNRFIKFVGDSIKAQSLIFYYGTSEVIIDAVRLYEISKDIYDKIGVSLSDQQVADMFPYVDSVQHLNGVAVIAEGENLLPNFYEATLANGASVLSPYELSATTGFTTMIIPSIKNQNYVLSLTGSDVGSRIDIFDDTVYKGTVTDVSTKTFTISSDKIKLNIFGLSNGTIIRKPMLTLGSTPKPFVPRNPSYLFADVKLGQIGDKKDILYKQDGQWYVRKNVEKDVLLDGSLSGWSYLTKNTGLKVVQLSGINNPATVPAIITKYDGKSNIPYNADSTTTWNTELHYIGGTVLKLGIKDTDSGFTEAMTPSADLIKSYFYGWKVKTVDGNGTPTAWISLGDGTDAPTQTLAYVSKNMAPNYTPYKLSYVLATPQTINVTDKVEGDIVINGLTQVEVTSGVIIREKANLHFADNRYYINVTSQSKLKNKALKILGVYEENTQATCIIGTNTGSSLTSYGQANATIFPAHYNENANYYVTYIVQDKHSMTCNATEVKFTYANNIRSAVDDMNTKLSDAVTDISVHTKSFIDIYVRLKALEVK